MKKFFAFLLTFAMLLTLAMPAMAAEGDSLSTIYIDVGQLEEAASVQSVYLYTKPDNLVINEPMTHVGGTIYSYDISAAVAGGATYVSFNTFSGDGETFLGSYDTANFETGKNLWTATGRDSGTWSTYTPTINGNTTGDVSASYTPSSTEDTTAKITGLYITVDGVKYDSSTAEAPVTIYSDSTVTVTVYGENFANLPEEGNQTSAFVYFGANLEYLYKDASAWSIDTTSNTATFAASHTILTQATTASELKYTNDFSTIDYSATILGSGVYVIYNEGTKPEDTTAKITGLYITVDGVKYDSSTAEAPVTIYSDSTVTVTVYGENFANLPEFGNHTSAFNYFGSNSEYLWKGASEWNIDPVSNTATYTANLDILAQANTASELKYTNDQSVTILGSGIYVIYNNGTKPQPTYTVTIDENIANGTVIADSNSAKAGDTVTLTVTPATGYQIGAVTVKDADGKTVDFTETGVASGKYTFTMPASAVTVTATFEAIPITFAEITWGSMSFTYSDEQVTQEDGSTADKGWDDSDTGWVTVKNTGNTTFTAQAKYESYEDYTEITGSFDPVSCELVAESSYTFNLELSGTPAKALSGDKIGKVTITITETPAASTIVFTIDGEVYTAEEGMTWAEWAESEYNTAGLVVNGNAIWDSEGFRFLTNVSEGVNVGSDSVIAEDTDYSWAFSL